MEYVTDIGRIDILALDSQNRFTVIELKVGHGPDSVCGQLMRYMGWARMHLAKGNSVRGFIIAQSISDKIRYAMVGMEGVELREYEIALKLKAVPPLLA